MISIRNTLQSDLNNFFTFQLDEEAQFIAAFTPKNPNDKKAYLEKWTKLMENPEINLKTILYNNLVVGSIAKFIMDGNAEVTYWIDKKYWGKGIATEALSLFLEIEKVRPLYARVAFDNIGSQKVLIKNGFEKIGESKFFANARKKEITEFIFKLT